MISFRNKKYLIFFSAVFFLLFATRASAATLFMNPSKAEVTVGNIVNIQVAVDTLDKVINNAESIVQFPKDLLEVVSVDKASIFSLWIEEPSYSNNAGQLIFNGGVPNPGFQGSNGKIISITFRAKKVGTASIVFSNSAVRENDGLGTDVLSGKIGSEITIPGVQTQPAIDTQTKPVTSFDFVITSSSHPNQNLWYNKNNIDLSWKLPTSATSVKTLLGAYPNSEPTVNYDKPITSKSLENLEDGIWYFHVNYLANGIRSKTQHYKLQIDTASPTDLSVNIEKDDAEKVTLHMKASDSLSGIDYYQVVADSDNPITVKSNANDEASIEVPFYRSGEHNLIISVFDKAGNKAEKEITIVTKYILELKIDSYPAKIRVNENIEISGTAPYPYASLRVSLKDNSNVVQTYKLKSNSYSKFNFISQPIPIEGNYTLWVDMLKDDEEISLSSQKVVISAETPLLLQVGSYTIGLMKVLIPATILLIVFLLIVLYGWHKFFSLYRKVRKESREAKQVLEKSFKILRKDLREHVAKLKRVQSARNLTSEEVDFLEQFEKELSEAEGVIEKEVKDISES